MAPSGDERSKASKFLEGYLEIALEGGFPFAIVGMIVGAIAGAFFGWSLLPPETVNLIQALLAILGLGLGAAVGFIAGLLLINVFWIAVAVGLVYFLGLWLLAN